jgi:hypothetical protein
LAGGYIGLSKRVHGSTQTRFDYGLNRAKYHYSYLTSKHFPTLEYELILTHSIMEFYKDIANGVTSVDLSYNGLGYTNHCLNPTAMLLNTYAKGSVKDVISFYNRNLMVIRLHKIY